MQIVTSPQGNVEVCALIPSPTQFSIPCTIFNHTDLILWCRIKSATVIHVVICLNKRKLTHTSSASRHWVSPIEHENE